MRSARRLSRRRAIPAADPGAKRAPPSLPAGIEDLSAKQFDNIFRLDRISVVE
jgi:hypothetical protein